MKNILMVDDHPLFLHGTRLMIEASFPQINVSTAIDFSSAKQHLQQQLPDLLLFDLMLPDKDGLKGLQELVNAYPTLSIIIISAHDDKAHIQTSMAYGAKGYLPKTSTPDEIIFALKKVHQGGCYTPDWFSSSKKIKVSKRKHEILMLVSKNSSNKEIAKVLNISEGTVKQHLYAVFKQLKVKNRKEAAHYVKEHFKTL
jgi:DNA-binding NarL/FixJ family response regulator